MTNGICRRICSIYYKERERESQKMKKLKQYEHSSKSKKNNTSWSMESSSATPSRNTIFPAMKLHPSSFSRRQRCTAPFSFSSSFVSSCNVPDHDDSPATTPFPFSGVPFSWEHSPGIPKKQSSNCKKQENCGSSSLKVLPLPPTTPHQTQKKKSSSNSKQTNTSPKDPFVAALVECSKELDDEEDQCSKNNDEADLFQWSAKVSRSVSDRFGFVNLYTSCRRSCAVSRSIVHVPRPISRPSSSNYDLISHRSRSPWVCRHHHHSHSTIMIFALLSHKIYALCMCLLPICWASST